MRLTDRDGAGGDEGRAQGGFAPVVDGGLEAGDNTAEVQERVRRKSEAALFNEARTKRRA